MSNPKHFKSIDEYILSLPKESQEISQQLRTLITSEIPEVKECISYNMPAFEAAGKKIVYFGTWKNHIAMYPYSEKMEKDFKEAQQYYTSGKGTIQFPLDKPLPKELIKKIVQYRLKESQEE